MTEIIGTVITSMEGAQMVGKEHRKLLRDIRNYVSHLNEAKIGFVEFFKESTYIDGKGEDRPCFMVTKKGCEFIAHKLTGQKGTEFTARYINRFHEREKGKLPFNEQIPIGEVASYIKAMDRIAVRQGSAPHKIAQAFEMVSRQFGIQLPADFVKVPEYEQYTLDIMKG